MQLKSKAYLQMHIATFLWGVTAILGKMISISELPLVWYRVLLVSISMCFIPKLFTNVKKLSKNALLKLIGIGIILTTHWVMWYAAIKYSNASVAVSCIACVSLFVAILEPLINNTNFDTSNLLLGIFIIPGILLINQSLDFNYKTGFVLGIIAACLAALFSIYNKKYTQEIEPNVITFVQMLSGLIFLTCCMPIYSHYNAGTFSIPNGKDIILLLVLSLCCTVIPYNLFLRALKVSDAFTTSLINNLEPIYGIIIAAILLNENEQLNWKFYIGTFIILLAVFIHAVLTHYQHKKISNESI